MTLGTADCRTARPALPAPRPATSRALAPCALRLALLALAHADRQYTHKLRIRAISRHRTQPLYYLSLTV